MPYQNLTGTEFESLIAQNDVVFIDFWAGWCAPCKQFATVYEQAAEEFPKVVFAKVNVEEEQEMADVFSVRSIPHLIVFKEGIMIYSSAGSMPYSTLKELVEQALAVDVSAIRAQLKAQEK